MLIEKRFKLRERTLAIELLDSQRRAVSVPAGAIIRVLSTTDGGQIVNVLWEGRTVEIFTCDVNMRGIEIMDQSAKAQNHQLSLVAGRGRRRRRNPH